MAEFKTEQIADFQEAFSLFDKNSNGTITSAELGTVLRSLGSNPTEEELGKLVSDINSKKNGVLDFKGFLQIMTQRKSDVDTPAEITEALKIFDKEGNGFLPASELKHILCNIGTVTFFSFQLKL
jgi:calmodulin